MEYPCAISSTELLHGIFMCNVQHGAVTWNIQVQSPARSCYVDYPCAISSTELLRGIFMCNVQHRAVTWNIHVQYPARSCYMEYSCAMSSTELLHGISMCNVRHAGFTTLARGAGKRGTGCDSAVWRSVREPASGPCCTPYWLVTLLREPASGPCCTPY